MSYFGRFVIVGAVSILVAGIPACSSENQSKKPDGRSGSGRGFKSPPREAGDSSLYAPITEPGVPVAMGFGIDLNNHKGIPNKCVNGTIETVPQQEGYIALDANYSYSDLATSLGGSSNGSVSFAGFGGSARANYMHTLRERSNDLKYVVFAYNKHHSKVFIPSDRIETWKTASPEEWLQSCGAGYVAAQDYGSMLFVNFSLHLEKRSETNSFSGGASAEYFSFAKLRADISANSQSNRSKGTLSVSALQIGGRPEELGKILKVTGDSQNGGLIESFALCDVSEYEKCLKGLRSIEDYIANVFPKQFDDNEKGGPALLTTYPFLYPKNIGATFNPGLDQYVLKARKTLSDLYEAEMADIETLADHTSKQDKESQSTIEKAKTNVSAIRAASVLCYDNSTYQQCIAKAEELRIACAETTVPDGMDNSREGGGTGSSSKE